MHFESQQKWKPYPYFSGFLNYPCFLDRISAENFVGVTDNSGLVGSEMKNIMAIVFHRKKIIRYENVSWRINPA